MHESVLARKLVQLVQQEVGAQSVSQVRARLAETETLQRDSIVFHFRNLAVGTNLEGVQLDLEAVHIEGRCLKCDTTYLPENHVLLCPKCGHTEATLSESPGLTLVSVVVTE